MGKVEVINKEPLTMLVGELKVTLNEYGIDIYCKHHKHSLMLFPTPLMGVCGKPHFKILKADKYIIEAGDILVNNEFVTNLRLIVYATGSITLISKVKPIKPLIPLNITAPHIKIHFKDFKWHIRASLTTTNEPVFFKESTLLVKNANIISFNNMNCIFSIFVGRCVLSIGDKVTLLYPRIYFQKQSDSSLSLGLSYSNLPSLSQFELLSSLTIHHTCHDIFTLRKEGIFQSVDFNIADALEPIKVAAYQKIAGSKLYLCPLLRTLNELTKKPSHIKWRKITLIELIEIITSLLNEYPNILDKSIELVKNYLNKMAINQSMSNQVFHYIKELIKENSKSIVNLAKLLAKEIVNKTRLHNPLSLFVALEILPLITYPPSHIASEIGLNVISTLREITMFARQNLLNNLGYKLTYLRSLALQTHVGAELIKSNFRIKSILRACIRGLIKTWDELNEASRLILAGFSNVIQFRYPKVFPLLNGFKVMYLLPFDHDVKVFLITPKGPHERIRFSLSPIRKTKVEVLNEFNELVHESSSERRIVELYLPYEQSEYFVVKVFMLP